MCSVFKRSIATPMSTIGLVKFISSLGSIEGLKRPAAAAESDLDRTQVRSTGITPPTSVLSSRMYFTSSADSSLSKSPTVAFVRLLFDRRLLADRRLRLLPFELDKTEIRSSWVVSRLRNWEVTIGRELGSN